ncbi:MAG: glycosyltransferase family 39 protein [Planctomycetota bacterium]|jgi:hypothetical protein
MSDAIERSKRAWVESWLTKLRPALGPALGILLALVPACVGITWGLPSEARFAKVTGADRARVVKAIIERTAADQPRKAAGLTFRMLDPREPDTTGRLYRRFALYSDHPDEMLVLSGLSRMKPRALKLDPGAYCYGGLFVYPIGVMIRVAGWLGLATVTREMGVYLAKPDLFGRMYLIGRLYVLAWHAAGLAALWMLARRMFGNRAAYAAIAIYALFPATVCFSHVMKPHLPGAALVLFAALALRSLDGKRGIIVAGALVGAAASMTPTYALAILLVPAHLWAGGGLRRSWKALVAGAAAAALVYAVLNPYAMLQPAKVLAEMRHGRSFYRVGLGLFTPVAFARYLPNALTWPGLVGAAAGIAWFVTKRRADAKMLAPALAAYFVVVSVFTARSFTPVSAVNARFGFFIYPFLALFMAGALEWAISRDGRLGLLAAGVLAAALVAGSIPHVMAYAGNARGDGTRHRAAAWMESHIPEGSRIGVLSRPSPCDVPPVELGRYEWVELWTARRDRAEWILTAGAREAPAGYREATSFRPPGPGPVFGNPDEMSFASPVFTLWARE